MKHSQGFTRKRSQTDRDSWAQWGYLRHQNSGEELLAVRKAFNAWKKRFSKIGSQPNPDRPWEKDAEWLLEHETVPAMRSAWHELDMTTRKEKWPLLMLSSMCTSPQRVHSVLEATMHPLPPGYAINDVLLFIARNLRLNKASTTRERVLEAEEIMGFLSRIMTETWKGRIPFTQRVFGLFAKALPGDQAHELYTLLRKNGYNLHANTLIQFASKLAGDAAHKEAAFEILQGLSDAGADLNEARPSSVITSLLHCKAPEERGLECKHSFNAKDALQCFIERGFTLNAIASTAFLDTLCQSGEVEEAIRLVSLFAESGVQLDKKTWTTVFRGAKGTLRMEHIARALELAKIADVPIVDVLNNALHSAFLLSEVERREKRHPGTPGPAVFAPLLRIYAKRFDLEPLQWWLPDCLPLLLAQGAGSGQQQGLVQDEATRRRWDFELTIIPFTDQLFSAGEGTKLRPSLTTIAIMLRAYIRSLQEPYDVVTYYEFFKSRLEEQSRTPSLATASRLVTNQGSLIHDTFILAMTDHGDFTRPALEIFGDMLKDQSRTPSSDTSSASRVHPAPTVLTFTILLRGLMNGRDRLLAEQILQIMREHGVSPNLVTWNTIVSGYAYMQNIARTVDTLQDMEATGLKPDIYTFKGFGRLRDQGRALKIMDGIIDANRQKMAGGGIP